MDERDIKEIKKDIFENYIKIYEKDTRNSLFKTCDLVKEIFNRLDISTPSTNLRFVSEININNINSRITNYSQQFPSLDFLNKIHVYNLLENKRITNSKIDGMEMVDTSNYVFPIRYIDTHNFFSIFYVTKEKLVFSYISTDGNIYFQQHLLALIVENFGVECLIDVIFDIGIFYYKQSNSYFIKFDPENCSRDLLNSILIYYFNNEKRKKVVSEAIHALRIYLKSIVETNNSYFDSVLINRNASYQRSILSLNRKIKQEETSLYQAGLNLGMDFFTSLQLAGYNFNADRNCWEKIVNIVPKRCFNDGLLYEINEDNREYKITRLYIQQGDLNLTSNSFYIKADGRHPNVNNGCVCLGELGQLWIDLQNLVQNSLHDRSLKKKIISSFISFLTKIEETLMVPNFDSAYFQMDYFKEKTTRIQTEKEKAEQTRVNTNEKSWALLE